MFSLGPSGTAPAAAVASLTLTPNSGDAPFATGTVSGSGWCSIPEGGYSKISGSGVSGAISLVLAGATSQVIGAFNVRGEPGKSVVVTVENRCRQTGGVETASAVFTFNGAVPASSSTPTLAAPAANPAPSPSSSSASAQDAQTPSTPAIVPPSTGDAALR